MINLGFSIIDPNDSAEPPAPLLPSDVRRTTFNDELDAALDEAGMTSDEDTDTQE